MPDSSRILFLTWHTIGQPAFVRELRSQEAHQRVQLIFRLFIEVFVRPEHPLVLFLDDPQWLDAATLDLIEDRLTRADRRGDAHLRS